MGDDMTQTQTQMSDKQLLDNFSLIGTKKYVATQCQSEIDRLTRLLGWINYGKK